MDDPPGQVGGHEGLAAALGCAQDGDHAARDPAVPDPLDRFQVGSNIAQGGHAGSETGSRGQDGLQDFLLLRQSFDGLGKGFLLLARLGVFERLPAQQPGRAEVLGAGLHIQAGQAVGDTLDLHALGQHERPPFLSSHKNSGRRKLVYSRQEIDAPPASFECAADLPSAAVRLSGIDVLLI